ncbi:MAG: histidine phosphatase family protein [Pseudazoarcus pumilus]|nr:histidine phosphatase family protein [Pseudazoarcus pumilus]
MKRLLLHALGALLLLAALLPAAHADEARALEAMRAGGVVILLRHTTTEPGIGDPPEFTLGNCATQRNLSAAGREEARRFGEALRAAGVQLAAVRSSRWCRCLDTARLAYPNTEVQAWPPLDSFFAGQGNRQRQTAEAMAALTDWPQGRNELWVTHQVNVSALTGFYLMMGEAVVARVRGGELEVIGRWRP